MSLEPRYNPARAKEIYAHWKDRGYFAANPASTKQHWASIMPPPNITGALHLGHVLQNSIVDAIVRFERLNGKDVLWFPGIDHAGIQLQGTIEKKLKKEEGKTREELGREKFLAYTWKWVEEWRNMQQTQNEALAISPDWARKMFTLDPAAVRAVRAQFKKFYDDGLLSKGAYIVHWDPALATAITDEEIEYAEEETTLYHIQYGPLVIATTRPESQLADVAIAVHPDDARYKTYIGTTLTVPMAFGEKQLPVIADAGVDKTFGTGALKVTPAHDVFDWELSRKHDLPVISIIGKDGRMTAGAGELAGLTVSEAREKTIAALKEKGLLVQEEPYKHRVAISERSKAVIEPIISEEWFVEVGDMAKKAAAVIRAGKDDAGTPIAFAPLRYKKQILDWLDNIRPWVVSRQLWWGHQMPVWYCESCNPKHIFYPKGKGKGMVVSADLEAPKMCPDCANTKLVQEEQVLDTWFSSGLWPLTTLGWPNGATATGLDPELEKYYPTDLMITAHEILYLWIARMIMLGLYHTGKVPFKEVFVHGMVRDEKGIKMSKSLGNGVDPLEMMEKYHADALRFALSQFAVPGRDIRMSRAKMEESIEASRNFATKVWNIARYVERYTAEHTNVRESANDISKAIDVWIADQYSEAHGKIIAAYTAHNLAEATRLIYDFFWHDVADWYVEMTKYSEYQSPMPMQLLQRLLPLLYPIMPLLTEELWTGLGFGESLMTTVLPKPLIAPKDADISIVSQVQTQVSAVRLFRADYGIARTASLRVGIAGKTNDDTTTRLFAFLARVELVKQASDIIGGITRGGLLIEPPATFDRAEEKKKIAERATEAKQYVARVEKKLSNTSFVQRAPKEIVAGEQAKLAKAKEQVQGFDRMIAELDN